MQNEKIEGRIINALRQQQPLAPVKHELGGGYYFTCHWYKCGETVNRFMDYCPRCGQRIDWRDK